MATLEERIDRQIASLDAEVSLYARHLASRREIAIRADAVVNTLSTIKLPVMVLAFRDAEAGLLDLDERHTLLPGEFRRGSGLLQTFGPGLQPSYRDLVTQMIVTSDNTATDILIGRLGRERVNQFLADRGYGVTSLQTTTGELFRRLLELADPSARALSPEEVYWRSFPRDADAPRRAFAFLDDRKRGWGARQRARWRACSKNSWAAAWRRRQRARRCRRSCGGSSTARGCPGGSRAGWRSATRPATGHRSRAMTSASSTARAARS